MHQLGKVVGGDARRLVAHQFVFGQAQQLGLPLLAWRVPRVKSRAAENALGNVLVVEGVDQRIVHQHVLAADFVLQLFDLAR